MGAGSIFYLAALKNIPEELYEQADIDGANIFRKTWHITFATLRPLLIIQFVGAVIGAFHATQRILVMTGGGPLKATHTMGIEIFFNAFSYMKFGYATAVAWIMGSLIIGFTVMQIRVLRNVRFIARGADNGPPDSRRPLRKPDSRWSSWIIDGATINGRRSLSRHPSRRTFDRLAEILTASSRPIPRLPPPPHRCWRCCNGLPPVAARRRSGHLGLCHSLILG